MHGPMQGSGRVNGADATTTDDLVSIDRAAEILDCHTMTVRRLIKAGKLGDVVRMGRKFVRIRRAAVEAYISKHTEEVIK
jgi:excisionase family DNA binding protein